MCFIHLLLQIARLTMLNCIILSSVLIALIPSASAQIGSLGTCSPSEIDKYIRSLNDGATCLAASNALLAGGPNIDNALNTYCTRECGGAILIHLLLNCGEAIVPGFVAAYLSCLPVTGSSLGSRCRATLPGIIDASVLQNVSPCASYNESNPLVCPSGCRTGLTTARAQVGCCFQAVYNDTDLLQSYLMQGTVNATEFALINQLRNPSLWSACQVDLTPQCTQSPFPRNPRYVSGTCESSKIDSYLSILSASSTLSLSCRRDYPNIIQSLDFLRTPTGMQTLDRICTAQCGGAVSKFYNDTCNDEIISLDIESSCLPSDGTRGNRCRYVLDRSLATEPVIINLLNCFTFDPSDTSSTCPGACRNALSSLSSEFGCCYQSIHNSTGYFDAKIVNEESNFPERAFWLAIRNPVLWDKCRVPLVKKCTGNAFSAAVKFIASFSVLLFVIVASLNL